MQAEIAGNFRRMSWSNPVCFRGDRPVSIPADAIAFRPATLADVALSRRWDEQPHVIASDPSDDWNWETELARALIISAQIQSMRRLMARTILPYLSISLLRYACISSDDRL
jgi:hypothetical protein